jgi:hypothetical protein
MTYTFMKHALSADERAWIKASMESPSFGPRLARIRLRDQIAPDFDPSSIDQRLYANDRPTLVGLWHINPASDLFGHIDLVANAIKRKLIESPDKPVAKIEATELATTLGLSVDDAARALFGLGQVCHFWTSAGGSGNDGFSTVSMGGEASYRIVLSCPTVFELMERRYIETPAHDVFGSIRVLRDKPDRKRNKKTRLVVRPNTAFVLMAMNPEHKELVDVYMAAKDVFKQFEVDAMRVDEIESPETITRSILREIRTREHLFADLTHERPNVYYEIGYAHALGKNPILFCRDGTKVHFDLSVHKVTFYENLTDLRAKLARRLEAILGRALQSR